MLKIKYTIPVFVIIIIGIIMTFTVFGKEGDISLCRNFLKGYGWETSRLPTDEAEITIPAVFDNVYENYNKIQKTAGLDLLPYASQSGKRYTFLLSNYPLDVGENVYANVIVINGKAVGGDIMTVSLSGFMHSLSEHCPY